MAESGRIRLHIGTGDDRETYEFDFNKVLNVELIEVEKRTGLTYAALVAGLGTSALATTAWVWICRKRRGDAVNFSEIQFDMGDVEIEDPDLDKAPEVEEAPKAPAKRGSKRSPGGRSTSASR